MGLNLLGARHQDNNIDGAGVRFLVGETNPIEDADNQLMLAELGVNLTDATLEMNVTAGVYQIPLVQGNLASDGFVVMWDDTNKKFNLTAVGGGGEVNTASNVGAAGQGFFKQKTGANLEFRNLNVGSTKLALSLDVPTNEVRLDVNEGNIVHQNLSGAGSNTHSQIDTHISDGTIHYTQASITTVGTVTTGNVDVVVSNASLTVKGKVELATSTETTTGSDATRSVTPDGFRGSDYGKTSFALVIELTDTAPTVADGLDGIPIPVELNGWNIVSVHINAGDAKGTSGTTEVQVRRKRVGVDVDVLTTKVTMGDEWFAADGSINTSNDDLATGDMLYVDLDVVRTGLLGLSVDIIAQKP